MIRKVIIVGLSLATVGMGIAVTASVFHPLETTYWKVPLLEDAWVDVRLHGGCFTFNRHAAPTPPTAEEEFLAELLRPAPRQWAGITWSRDRVSCPLWPSLGLVALLATYPTIAFLRGPLRRRRRRRKGLCLRCGYNLTGLPEPRCSECGKSLAE
ncbi:MAG: hypothetical protein ACYSUI_01195 [Planctomycetota bacterium]